jgi:hypothetical protein
MATCAAITGTVLPNDAAEDGYNMLPVWLGTQGGAPVRRFMLQQTNLLEMSIRDGHWKYLDHKGSGGYPDRRKRNKNALKESGSELPGQLYNLESDPGETANLYSRYPEIVKKMKTQLDAFKSSGRSASLR